MQKGLDLKERGPMAHRSSHWFMRLHPAIIAFSYTGFLFFGGFWNWVFRGHTMTFLAASVCAGAMLIPSLLCLGIPERKARGLVGFYLGFVFCTIISCLYAWRAYLAIFEQSNTPKTILIATQVLLGIATCVLLLVNRDYTPPADSAVTPTT